MKPSCVVNFQLGVNAQIRTTIVSDWLRRGAGNSQAAHLSTKQRHTFVHMCAMSLYPYDALRRAEHSAVLHSAAVLSEAAAIVARLTFVV